MGNRLRALRAVRRWSQRRLAKEAGIGEMRVWKFENGYAEPTDLERSSIANALGLPESRVWSKRPLVSEGK
jgi:transcriptional regulator with XRE-family HTH domain